MPRHPEASHTTDGLRSSVFEAIARKVADHEGEIFPLHVGDTWMEPHPAARAEAQRTEDHPLLHTYAHPHGEPALLDAIAERLSERGGRPVGRSEVQVTEGATGGLSVVCQTLLDPGDEVLIPAPFWPLIPGIVASRGAVPVQVPFWTELGDEAFDPEAALEERVTERTVALYLNSPNNPTGRILGEQEVAAVARVAGRHDLWVVSDEAYEEIWFQGDRPEPVWAREDLRDRTIATHTFSKGYGMAGARIGWSHGPAEVMARVRAVFTHQAYCAPRPMQYAALGALREAGEWVAGARRRYARAAEMCAESLERPVPEAGTFLFFPLDRWIEPGRDVLPFFERCLVEAGVLLTPGVVSGADYERWARLCFTSVSPRDLERSLERLSAAL